MISIHTPAKGATGLPQDQPPRPSKFQSTHPRRVRPFAITFSTGIAHFNPHTREGCDSIARAHISFDISFQSTHPRRVRPKDERAGGTDYKFQSTHPRRVRLYGPNCRTRRKGISIHTPAKGATINPWGNGLVIEFQSTHPRRVRQYIQFALSISP